MSDGKIIIQTSIENKSFDKQIAELKAKAKKYEKTLESDLEIPIKFRMSADERKQLESDLEKTKNQIISLRNQASKDIPNIGDNFKKTSKSIKRFALSLLSVGSIFAVLSKASNSYTAADEKNTNQIEANWIGMGTILSPVIEMIMSLMKKAVTGILYFMTVLTGTNYIAKANEQVLKNQSKGMKDLSKNTNKATKSLLAFDEANVLSSETKTESNTGNQIDTSVLFDVNDLGNSTISTIKKIGEALQPVYKTIKKIIEWCLEHPDVIIRVLGGLAILGIINKIIGFGGTGGKIGTGLLGLKGVLGTLATIGVIAIGVDLAYSALTGRDLIDDLKEIKKGIDDLNYSNENTKKTSEKLAKSNKEIIKNEESKIKKLEAGNKKIKQYVQYIQDTISAQSEIITKNNEWYNSLNPLDKIVAQIAGDFDKNASMSKNAAVQIDDLMESYKKLYEQNQLTDDEVKVYLDLREKLNSKEKQASGIVFQVDAKYLNLNNTVDELSETSKKASREAGILGGAIGSIPKNTKITVDTKFNKPDDRELRDAFNKIKGGLTGTGLFTILGFDKIKLARGGVVNNPGKGVPISNNIIAGEEDPEAVLPLTEETLSMLGQFIGRHITIENIIDNNIDGRRLNRILKTSNGITNFARNGG